MFDKKLKITSTSLSVEDVNFLSCHSDNLRLYWDTEWLILNNIRYYCVYNAFTVPCKKSMIASLTYSKMKNIDVFYYLVFGSALMACFFLRSIAMTL